MRHDRLLFPDAALISKWPIRGQKKWTLPVRDGKEWKEPENP